MQTTLPFKRIDAHDAAQQRQRIAEQHAQEHPAAAALQAAVKRPVGRPKRPLDATAVLRAAAAAAAAATAAGPKDDSKRQRRGEYTRWFSSPFIQDILKAYAASGFRARRTVSSLRAKAPDGRFERLNHSTLRSWYDKSNQLLPHFQRMLQDGGEDERERGPQRALAAVPEAEAEIERTLLRLRAAGSPMSIAVVRLVMHAILMERAPGTLSNLSLSAAFISRWVRAKLNWRWRSATTAASKLPADWEDQGIKMAMRVAATMGLHQVRRGRDTRNECAAASCCFSSC